MDKLQLFLTDPRTERVIVALIIINGITLGLETNPSVVEVIGPILSLIDRLLLAIFVFEIGARLIVHRSSFFRDPWSVFDLTVIGIALVPATGALSVLRALRALRVLRLITALPSLKSVVGGLISALPGMGAITLLLGLIIYVFAVMATKLFGHTNPEQFGSLGNTAYTLFQVMTFDDWSGGIVKPLAEHHPYAVAFFLIFILLSTFMALNLFIGVIVNAIDAEMADDAPKLMHAPGIDERLLTEIVALRREVAELKVMTKQAA